MKAPAGESFLDSQSIYCIFRKNLSVEALNDRLRERFKGFYDPRDPNRTTIPLVDALMSAFAMFTLKIPSMLALDKYRMSADHTSNLASLFGIEKIPSDTAMREIVDEVDPNQLRVAFRDVFRELQRGKSLEEYVFMDGRYLVAIDGTGYFSSDSVHCPSCLEKQLKKDGTTTYHHQMLGAVVIHPDKKVVIPLCPEPIIKQDGETKNDCERNACGRILEHIRRDHPRLNLIVTEDGLSSNAPHIRDLKKHGMSFILGAKPGDHKFLFEEYSLAGSRTKEVIVRVGKTVHLLRYVNGLQLNEKSEDVMVNFLEYSECTPGKGDINFTWVTDIEITDDNVFKIMRGGRARWKIENETFNTLKNHGYEFEHNYGHGYKNLSVNLAFLMMLAFLIDQAQLLTSNLVQLALKSSFGLRNFYRKIRNLFETFVFKSWIEIYQALAYGFKSTLTINQPNSS